MTMLDMKCDVCNKNPAIGVASTSVPYSCAYCKECASRSADPEMVFIFWADDIAPDDHRSPDQSVTYKDGQYMTYREWYAKYGEQYRGAITVPA